MNGPLSDNCWRLGKDFPNPPNRLKVQIRHKVLVQPDAGGGFSQLFPGSAFIVEDNFEDRKAILMASSTGIWAKTSNIGTFSRASITDSQNMARSNGNQSNPPATSPLT